MSDLDNYWLRKSRISRRRLLGSSAAAGIGLGALGLVGCGDDDDDDDAEPTSPPSGGTTAASPSAGASPTTAAKQKGGTAHFVSANNTYDTFDVDRSRFSPVALLFGFTNLGVMQWDSFTGSGRSAAGSPRTPSSPTSRPSSSPSGRTSSGITSRR